VLVKLSLGEKGEKGGRGDSTEDGPHHDNQGDSYERQARQLHRETGQRERARTQREGDLDKLDFFEDDLRVRYEVAQDDPDGHREEYPQSE
jgi:hypothetical protein